MEGGYPGKVPFFKINSVINNCNLFNFESDKDQLHYEKENKKRMTGK